MGAVNTLSVNMDCSGLEASARVFQNALLANGLAVRDFIATLQKFDAQHNVLETSFKGFTADGREVGATLANTKKGFEVLGYTVKQSKQALDEFLATQKQVAEASRLAAAQAVAAPIVASFDPKNVSTASASKQSTLSTAQSRLTKSLIEAELPAADVQAIFDRIKQGFVDVESGARQKVQKALLDVKKAFEGIDDAAALAAKRSQDSIDKIAKANKKAADELKKQQDEIARRATIPGAEGSLRSAFPTPTGASIEQINRYEASLQSVLKMLANGKLTLSQFQALLAQVKTNPASVIQGLTPDENTARQALTRISQAFKEAESTGAGAGKAILISWQGIVRLLETLVVRRFAGFLIQDLVAIQGQSYKYAETISRIAALNQDAHQSTQQWSKSLHELADANKMNVGDAATAAYEGLGSRLKDTANATVILGEAFRFSRTTGMDAKNSLDLITTAMQAYNLTAAQSTQVTSAFYATQSVGKVTLEQLHLGYGRVAQIAANLGINMNEVLGVIAGFTNAGIRSADAFNLLFAMLQKLQHPTQDMQHLFREWGVATGEMAVQTFGLIGVFQKLQAEISKGGGQSRLVELQRDIRSVRGASALFGQEILGQLPGLISQIENGAERYQNAQKIFQQNPRMQLAEEFQKISNFFQTDFGEQFAASISNINNQVGGFSKLVKTTAESMLIFVNALTQAASISVTVASVFGVVLPSLATMTTVLITGAAAWATYKAVILLSTTAKLAWLAVEIPSIAAMWASTTAFGANTIAAIANRLSLDAATISLITFFTAQGAAASALRVTTGAFVAAGLAAVATYLSIQRAQAAADSAANLRKHLGDPDTVAKEVEDKANKAIEARRAKDVEDFRKFYDKKLQIVLQYVAKVNASIAEQQNRALAAEHNSLQGMEAGAHGMGNTLEKKVRELKDLQVEVRKIIDESQKRVTNLQASDDQKGFERSLTGANDSRRQKILMEKVQELQAGASDVVGVAGNYEVARKKLEEVNALLDKFYEKQKASNEEAQKFIRNTRAQNEKRDFNYSLADKTLPEQISLTLDRVRQLKRDGEQLFQIDEIENARKKFEEVDKLLDRIHQLQHRSNEESKKFVRNLDEKSDRRQFERSLSSAQPWEQTQLTLDKVKQLKKEALDLFNKDEVEDSRKKFEEIDKLLEKIYERQKTWDEKAKKLGIRIPGTSEIDKTLAETENMQRALEQGRLTSGQDREKILKHNLDQASNQHLGLEEGRRAEGLGRALEMDLQITKNREYQVTLERQLIDQERERLRIAIIREQTIANQIRESEKIRERILQLTTLQAEQQSRLATAQRQRGERAATVGGSADAIVTEIRRLIRPQDALMNNLNRNALKGMEQANEDFKKDPSKDNALDLLKKLLPVEKEFKGLQQGGAPLRMANKMTIDQAFDRFRDQLSDFANSLTTAEDAKSKLKDLDAGRKKIDKEIPDDLREEVQRAVQQQLAFQGQIKQLTTEIINSFTAIRDATRNMQEKIQNPQQKALGGFMQPKYFATGGPVGTDTIPAWLSKGEYVMDAANTSKFYPQLVSMSMGLGPARGGPTSNVNVGDINISYQATDSAQTDVRRLGEQLRREIRRGTLRLN